MVKRSWLFMMLNLSMLEKKFMFSQMASNVFGLNLEKKYLQFTLISQTSLNSSLILLVNPTNSEVHKHT